MHWIFYPFLGFLPAFLWLLYFLRKDVHPESRTHIARVFILGALATVPALIAESGISRGLDVLPVSPLLSAIAGMFIGVALVEEVAKYLVVRWGAIPTPAFDEPIDTIIYMVTAAMGFAAVENIVIFLKPGRFETAVLVPVTLSLVRFLGATLLHALASATIGFFIALSILHRRAHGKLLLTGIGIGSALHGLYNFAIIHISGSAKLYVLGGAFALLILIVTIGLREVRRLLPICYPSRYSGGNTDQHTP